jgi:DNA-binding GntR family transcriptional regulator
VTREATTKQEMVYRTICDRILGGEYGPGFRLVIDSLARELEVSALPVREAIRRLEAEGLVVYRANVGAQVAPADPELWEEQTTVLAVLEGFAGALAAPELTGEDMELLRELNDGMAEALASADPLAFGRRNAEFHRVIFDRCPNGALIDTINDISRRLDAIRRTVFVHIPYRGAASVEEHRELIGLFERGAPASEIERAMREHKLHTLESFRVWRAEHGSSR